MLDEDFEPLSPVSYIQIEAECYFTPPGFPTLSIKNFAHYGLPNMSSLAGEEQFADVALGWNLEGLELFVNVKSPLNGAKYPAIKDGDSFELFLDTRDVKTSGYNTRFCHHFFFLPESVEGQRAGEITRFRTEDTHELCDPSELQVKMETKWRGYQLHLFIPKECLHGYDPEQFDRMGFTYRINRLHGSSQHFSVSSDDYPIEQQPSLWSSLRLVK